MVRAEPGSSAYLRTGVCSVFVSSFVLHSRLLTAGVRGFVLRIFTAIALCRLMNTIGDVTFPLGRPILAMIFTAVLAGTLILFRHSPPRADLALWVSADLHARMYQSTRDGPSLLDQFHARTGKSVRLDLINTQAMDVRLLSLFMFAQGNSSGADTASPDVVEVPLESIGKYFRPPVDEVGFLPLNEYLAKSGWMDRIVPSRFSPWSKGGRIFGVPHDLHPCTLSYRKDLFDAAGVDLESASTWPELQVRCLAFQKYWIDHGRPRTALGMSSSRTDSLSVLLRQQHVELVDADLSLHFIDPKVVSTLCWYARAVAGPKRIATDLNPSAGQSAVDLVSDDVCGLITPDWMVADLKQYGPGLSGKLRMIPLPRFNDGDARTASWGGTMIGITKTCRNPDLAWRLIEQLYLDPAAIRERQKTSGILPPIREYWVDPVYHQADSFYGRQKIDELYIQLAGELPETRMTPYTAQAQIFFALVLNQAVAKVRSGNDADLESVCQKWLADAQARLNSMIQFDSK
jgi:arabinosaccharide transport system substrate-binding protein